MHYNPVIRALVILLHFLPTLFSQLHTETITALQSDGTSILKALQEKQISRPPNSPDSR